MIQHMTLELTGHRIAGPEGFEREWGPRVVNIGTGKGRWMERMDGRTARHHSITVILDDLDDVGDGFYGGMMGLEGTMGQPLGRRPFLVYTRPCDVPVYTAFRTSDGLFSVGIRMPIRWAKEGELTGAGANCMLCNVVHDQHEWSLNGHQYVCDGTPVPRVRKTEQA